MESTPTTTIVSACLLRNGEIAFAIAKERINRHEECGGLLSRGGRLLPAEGGGITIDDVDLAVVRNCYVLPRRRVGESGDPTWRCRSTCRCRSANSPQNHPWFNKKSDKVVTISHHLAHAYSAFAACPFEEGVVMVVDGVGGYRSDVMEPYPQAPGERIAARARSRRATTASAARSLEAIKKVWLEPGKGFLSDEVLQYGRPSARSSSCVSTYVFGDWNKCGELMGLAPYGRPHAVKPFLEMQNGDLKVNPWPEAYDKPWLMDRRPRPQVGHRPGDEATGRISPRQIQDDTEQVRARARALAARNHRRQRSLHGRRRALNCVANGKLAREARLRECLGSARRRR